MFNENPAETSRLLQELQAFTVIDMVHRLVRKSERALCKTAEHCRAVAWASPVP